MIVSEADADGVPAWRVYCQ